MGSCGLLQKGLPRSVSIHAHSDCSAVGDFAQGVAAPTANRLQAQVVRALHLELQNIYVVTLSLVKAHSGQPWNELADVLARNGITDSSRSLERAPPLGAWLVPDAPDRHWAAWPLASDPQAKAFPPLHQGVATFTQHEKFLPTSEVFIPAKLERAKSKKGARFVLRAASVNVCSLDPKAVERAPSREVPSRGNWLPSNASASSVSSTSSGSRRCAPARKP